jgi:biotin transport system substrate-specific component
LAAFVAGWLAERGFDRRYLTAVVAMICGLAVVFAGGLSWLAFFTRPAVGVAAAVRVGFTPFIVADLLKLLAAAAVMPGLWWLKSDLRPTVRGTKHQ